MKKRAMNIINFSIASAMVPLMVVEPVFSNYALAATTNYSSLDKKDLILGGTDNFNIDTVLNSDKVTVDQKAGVITTMLTAEEAANSSLTTISQGQPIVLGMYDAANNIGTIQILKVERYSDGSARLMSKIFSPYDFDQNDNALSKSAFKELKEKFGQNPFDDFKTNNSEYKQAFVSSSSNAIQTAMGLIMQNTRSTTGVYLYLSPNVSSETHKKGGKLKKKVTTTVRASVKPIWSVLTPTSVGIGGVEPSYLLRNGKKITGGVNIYEVGTSKTNFPIDSYEFWSASKTKKGWTGLALGLFGFAVGALTGFNPIATAAIGYTFKESLSNNGDWAMGWQNEMRKLVKEGPLDMPTTLNGREIKSGNQFRYEKINWTGIATPPNSDDNENIPSGNDNTNNNNAGSQTNPNNCGYRCE